MLIQIDLESEVPLYTQLMYQIIEGIATGQLAQGESLPAVRTLAADLGINLHTVNKAYQLLKHEGYVQIHRKKGAIVHPDSLPIADEVYLDKLRQQLRPLVAEAVCRGMEKSMLIQECEHLFDQLNKQEANRK